MQVADLSQLTDTARGACTPPQVIASFPKLNEMILQILKATMFTTGASSGGSSGTSGSQVQSMKDAGDQIVASDEEE
eukprot:COSAG01_NODE_3818_length_5664_cov_1277.807616_3_plen_77_part_00